MRLKRKKGIYILHDLSGSQLLGNQAQSLIGVLNCVEHQSLHVLSVLGSAQRVRRPEPKLLLRLAGEEYGLWTGEPLPITMEQLCRRICGDESGNED